MKIIPATAHRTSKWSGGTTTELFIYPETSSYAERDFLFRISTASIETEFSEFTLLHGVDRFLMALSGKLELHHRGHYSKELEPYQWDHFSGEWNTSSRGMGRDFNLMLKKTCSGSIEAIHIQSGDKAEFTNENGPDTIRVYYIWKGTIQHIDQSEFLKEGDVLVLEGKMEIPQSYIVNNDTCIIRADIHLSA